MCGRINVSDNEGVRLLLAMLGMDTWPSHEGRYNIAPTSKLDVVHMLDTPVVTQMSWGVSMTVKGKTGKLLNRRIPNSRSDKVWSSPLWRKLIPAQRVLVPVNGFYEWKRRNKKLEATYYITPANADAMFFAGIYQAPRDEAELPEVSIVTTEANEAMSAVHDRMPVILLSANEAMAWIQESDRDSLDKLMCPASNDTLLFTQVSSYVNKSSNAGVKCIEPIAA